MCSNQYVRRYAVDADVRVAGEARVGIQDVVRK